MCTYLYAMDFSSYEPFVMCPCPRARFVTGKNAKWQKKGEANTHRPAMSMHVSLPSESTGYSANTVLFAQERLEKAGTICGVVS